MATFPSPQSYLASLGGTPVISPVPTSEAVAYGGSVTSWTFSAFTDPDSRIASYSATLTAVVGSGSLLGTGLGPYGISGTADGDAYTVELDALDSGGAVLATATHSVAITATASAAGYVAGSFVPQASIRLNGVDEYVDFGNPASLIPTNGGTWSVSAWFRTFDSSYNPIYSLRSLTNPNNWLQVVETSRAVYVAIKFGGQELYRGLYNAIATDAWNHVLATSDGTDFRAWINGSEVTAWSVGSASYPGPTETWDGTELIWIGRTANSYFNGLISNVAVWSTDQAANAAAIYALDRTGDMRALGTPPDLLYVPFKVYGDSETTAGGISDLSGNNYDGSGVNLDGDELQATFDSFYTGDSR